MKDGLSEGINGGEGGATGYEPSVRNSETVRLPEKLRREGPLSGSYEFAILGSGCAGLSLCHYLLERGVTAPILIVDRRSVFEDDRTWCFWDVEPTPFSHLAMHRWNSWSLHAEGESLVQTTERYPYLCLTATDFYRHALESLALHENVEVRLGEEARGYEETGDVTRVETSGGTCTARYVVDGRGLPAGSPVFEEARRTARWVPQKFVGLRLRARRPVFDPEVCTLMDFSVSQERGLRFMYVLPFTGREALVENVYLSEARVSPEESREEVSDHLRESYGLVDGDFIVDGEEHGYIPMTDYRFPRRLGERAYTAGMLGGETRPSTGYTFLRIQRYCRMLAEGLTGGVEIPERIHPRRYDLLDGIFLRFMVDQPGRMPGIYNRMFAGVPPDPLVRFLTERSSLADELRLISALPKMPFIRVVERMLVESLSRSS